MTFLMQAGGALMGADTVLIKAADIERFIDAHGLLERAQTILAAAQADAARITDEARAQGLAAAHAEVRETVESALAGHAVAISAELARQRSEIATLAFAATEAIIGALDPDALAAGLAASAVARLPSGAPLQIEVATARVAAVRSRIGDREGVTVEGNPALADGECRILTGDGQIIADRDVQLAALAERWGLISGGADA